ncbi:HHR044Wp [Eremothecium sinecaudum]|uniref:HHR044Wp n=1 Tax=Eremothecium sinecaudum TaxID=45286 RepID=A0A109V0D3_9SACH|nr:HHR044Wp [Eremothecium sinecaudum]AMD22813.1 HHR044Wp [Eremothecium sinecaudum]
MGKRFSESAAKKLAGQARKKEQAAAKDRAERERMESEEAQKWEEGAKTPNQKKLLEMQKREEKLRAKQERESLLAAEEEALGKGGKGKKGGKK